MFFFNDLKSTGGNDSMKVKTEGNFTTNYTKFVWDDYMVTRNFFSRYDIIIKSRKSTKVFIFIMER